MIVRGTILAKTTVDNLMTMTSKQEECVAVVLVWMRLPSVEELAYTAVTEL